MQKVDFTLFTNLLVICYQRVNLNIDELDVTEMIKDSPKSLESMINLQES